MTNLRDLQDTFARALRATAAPEHFDAVARIIEGSDDLTAADRIGVYRNNTRQFFRAALELTYPVLQRRVGDDFFRQLAHEYRQQHPSRHGDLHRVGAAFPAWLALRLGDTEYAWLADLAGLEWACEEAGVAARLQPVALTAFAAVPATSLEHVTLALQPSLRLVASRYPIWSVWEANQREHPGTPVDLARGAEHCVVTCTVERVAVHRLEATDYALLTRLHAGDTLGAAMTATHADDAVLTRLLRWMFDAELVVGLAGASRAHFTTASSVR